MFQPARPLEGVRVLELGALVAAPYCGMLLAANVVAVPDDVDHSGAARVIGGLLADPVLTAELVDLGGAKLGKIQP